MPSMEIDWGKEFSYRGGGSGGSSGSGGADSHTHSNKATLDAITSTVKQGYDTAATNSHTHSNKTVLDGITSEVKSGYDTAATNSHTHSNKTVLDKLTQTMIDNSHTHSNKTVLDGITADKVAQIETNKTNISKIVKTLRPDADMFVSDETAVSTKVVPQDVDKFAVVSTISGRTVKNIWDEQYFRGTWDSADGSKKEVSSTSANVASLNYIAVDENKTYSSTVEIKVCCYTSSKSYIGNIANAKTFKPLANTAYITFNTYGSSYGETGYHNDISLYEGSISNAEYKKLYSAPIESVVSVGRNLWDEQWELGGWVSTTGLPEAKTDRIRNKNHVNVEPSTNYTFIMPVSQIWVYEYSSTAFLKRTLIDNGATLRTSSTTAYINFFIGENTTTYTSGTAIITPYKTTISVPNEARNCVGYGLGIGDICNEIDFESKVYTQRVAEKLLKDLTWELWNEERKIYRTRLTGIKLFSMDLIPNLLTSKYTTVKGNDTWTSGVISADTSGATIKDYICVCDTKYSTLDAFKASLDNQTIVYELATPSTTNLSDIIPPIRVESGGTVTLENEHSLDVANTVVYKKEVLA